MGNINVSTARTKAYAKEQRTMSNERHSKQTQTNPIPPPPSCAGKESRISERNAYPDLSGQHQISRIQYRESSIFPILPCIHGFITQNKANVKMGNINISTARTKAYANEQRTMNNEHYPKQTQSNPIFPAPPKPRPSFLSRYRTLRAEFAHELPQLSTDTFDLLHALSY
jgi:hypothetical protein